MKTSFFHALSLNVSVRGYNMKENLKLFRKLFVPMNDDDVSVR